MTRRRRTKLHFEGCLLGGAVGDALGAAIEFDSLAAIRRRFGPRGLTDLAEAYGRVGAITDDTQMAAFTAEALLRAHNRWLDRGICSVGDVGHHAYLRWLHTQGGARYSELMMERGWLVDERGLHARRAPGNSCLSALQTSRGSSADRGTARRRINNSKGCGGVMRMAAAGLTEGLDPFDTGCELAAITHGHPTGFLAAGAFAQLIHALSVGQPLGQSVDAALARLQGDEAAETREALELALELASHAEGTAEEVERLGQGWIAEEALAIGVFCALTARDFRHGVLLAVNHGGDSDSTGSVAGNILGLIHGVDGIPAEWLQRLELREVLTRLASDLWLHFGEGDKPAGFDSPERPPDWERYPGN